MAHDRLSDAELVRRCRLGDDGAWRELVEVYSRYVYAIATHAYRLRPEEADDAFQEVFTRVYERLGQLRDAEALRPWIGQLARRVCLDALRRDARPASLEVEAARDEAADDSLARIEEAFEVRELLDELGDPCREILDRFFARDESYRTIGEALDLPAGTIASRISRCLGKLRTAIEGRRAVPTGSSEGAPR